MLQIGTPSLRAFVIALIAGACLLFSPLASAQVTPDSYGHVIGIKLGGTYASVGVMQAGKVEILLNAQGHSLTPCYVAYTNEGPRIVDVAYAAASPSNTVFNSRYFLGRNFNDSQVQTGLSRFPYKIIDKAGKPVFEVELPSGKVQHVTPEEATAIIIWNMRDIAESYLDQEVTHGIITVPAYFDDNQRQAVKDAGKIAGLNVLRIVNEPTAASLAYGMDKTMDERIIMVYDIGASTTDTTLVAVDDDIFEILAHATIQVGGHDFNQRIVNYLTTSFNTKNSVDITHDPKAISRLTQAVEGAKKAISKSMMARIEIPDLFQGKGLSETLTRAKFEELNLDLFKQVLEPTDRVLRAAGVRKEMVNNVIAIGGSSYIPYIQRAIEDSFDEKPHRGIKPDEAIAFGAALQGGLLAGEDGSSNCPPLFDFNTLSLGIETAGGIAVKVLPRHSALPNRKARVFTTALDNQSTFKLRIVAGNGPWPRTIPSPAHGTGLLDVTADDEASGTRLFSASTRPSVDFTIDSKIADHHVDMAERHFTEDMAAYERVKAELGLKDLEGVLAVSGQGPVVKTNVGGGKPVLSHDEL
ncbi:Glucose-regulated protein [Apiospora rasikravindrae]|uniref:Glucose-regulated protein n=1 Tax=Apiospora rasikravindrae TaxID=990691 RepID=A0ABR1SEU3_9PEZI